MPRLRKQGLSYFPFDTDFYRQTSTRIILRRFGPTGINLYLYILCNIYMNDGYYIGFDFETTEYTCLELGMSKKSFDKIINYCLEIEIFDERLWKEKRILTSYDIQNTYQCAKNSLRRKTPLSVSKDIWLIEPDNTMNFIVFED